MNALIRPVEHPLLALHRPTITTHAIEGLGAAIADAIEARFRGLSVFGFAQMGKTRAGRYFFDHPDRIHPTRRSAAIFWDAPDVRLRSDVSFYRNWLLSRHLRMPTRAVSGELANLVLGDLVETAQQSDTDLVTVIIDEAQRLLPADYEHLVSLDNAMARMGYYLFIIFIYQRDITGFTNELISDTDFPPHVTCRFRIRKHVFEGLRDVADVHFALSRYDEATEFPIDSGLSYTRFFMREAFDRGWRLAKEAERLFTNAQLLRANHRLSDPWTWPMRSFEATLTHLLTVVGPGRYDFGGFSDDEVQQALRKAGFIEIEQSRSSYQPKLEA
jgi:hypothetical protein